MSAIIVSIVIPCYNSEKHLNETINSVLNQTLRSWECIFINDGSKDKTEQIILDVKNKDQRIKYIYQENSGVCVARNNAIQKAEGKYILCLDADDLISPNFLEETVKVLDSKPEVAVVTSLVQCFGEATALLKPVFYDLAILLAKNELVVTSLFRKADFDRVGGFNLNMKDGLEDWDFWIALLKKGSKVEYVENAIFYYRISNVSRNNSISEESLRKLRFQIWQNHKELFSEYFVDPTKCFEYRSCMESREYVWGKRVLNPLDTLKGLNQVIKRKILTFLNKKKLRLTLKNLTRK